MRRFGITTGIILLSIILILFFNTSSVKRSTYFETEYYKNTIARIDSIKRVTLHTYDSLQAGFARVSITPLINSSEDDYQDGRFVKVPLAGYGARKGKSATGIHDSIFVKAAAMKVGNQTIIFASADLLIMPPNIIDSLTIMLSKEGITRDQLFLSATHTHSSLGGWGPGYIGKLFSGNENINLEKWILHQTAKAIITAIDDLKPARIGSGSFNAEKYTHNRAIGESGTKNNDFSFITLEQKGHRKTIIGSFSAHSTTLGSDNMEISADYPGYWARKVEGTSADIAIFFAGSTGSQSPETKGDGFNKPKYLGEALADCLNCHLATIKPENKIAFSTASLKIQLPAYHIRLTTKYNLSTFLSKKLMPMPENVYLQVIRIGNMIWITTPCDFSGEYAKQIKNSLSAEGYDSNITSFNGSYVGYIVPGRYFYLNDYESKLMGWFGPDMGEYTMDLIRQMLRVVTTSNNI